MSFKTIDFTKAGGLYVYQDTLKFMQEGYTGVLDAIAKFFGDKVIIQGVTPAGGGTVTNGWAVVDGEILPIVGGTPLSYLAVTNLGTAARKEQFDNGTQQTVYSRRELRFSSVSSGNYTYVDFVRLPYSSLTVQEVLDKMQIIFSKAVLPEHAVIIDGCEVTHLSGTTTGTATITGGIVIMDGKYVEVQERTAGAYPCWLKTDGTYATSDPGGTNVLFDWETSQRHKHVMKRYLHETAEVVMSKNPADLALFDVATGLGKWKWLGWQLSEDLRGRVPVGVDVRTSDPGGGVWDFNYTDVNNQGGEKEHTLIVDEMPAHKHNVGSAGDKDTDLVSTRRAVASNEDVTGNIDIDMLETGGDQAHENRQPYTTILFIERI